MSRKLYVGNLSFNVTTESLEDMFNGVGKVASARVITDRDTGKSKGFGFVEMDSEDLAKEAIEKFDGRDVGGRRLKVSPAREQIRSTTREPMVNYQQ